MTEQEFKEQAKALADSQAKFVDTVKMMTEGIDELNDRFRSWGEYLHALNDTLHEYSDLSKQLLETHRAMLKAFGEIQVAINQNTDRLNTTIVKMESYFGSGSGLEYDN